VRLIDSTSDATPTRRTACVSPQYTRDEQLYYGVRDGIVSVRRVETSQTGDVSPCRLIACSSTEPSPMLINIVSSLTVQTLNTPANQNIGIIRRAKEYLKEMFKLNILLSCFVFLINFWTFALKSFSFCQTIRLLSRRLSINICICKIMYLYLYR